MFSSAIAVRKGPWAVYKLAGINKTNEILFTEIGGRLDSPASCSLG